MKALKNYGFSNTNGVKTIVSKSTDNCDFIVTTRLNQAELFILLANIPEGEHIESFVNDPANYSFVNHYRYSLTKPQQKKLLTNSDYVSQAD